MLTSKDVDQCIRRGKMETAKAIDELSYNVVVFGEIGIGNTTTSATLIAISMEKNSSNLCGSRVPTSCDRVNHAIVTKKIAFVQEAIKYHEASKIRDLGDDLWFQNCSNGWRNAGNIQTKCSSPYLWIHLLHGCNDCLPKSFSEQSTFICYCINRRGQSIALDKITNITLTNDIPPPEGPALCMKLRMDNGMGGLAVACFAR
ncbi:hypothetical protein ACHAW6_001474 [Cyclotella cf. meneghiniana]